MKKIKRLKYEDLSSDSVLCLYLLGNSLYNLGVIHGQSNDDSILNDNEVAKVVKNYYKNFYTTYSDTVQFDLRINNGK